MEETNSSIERQFFLPFFFCARKKDENQSHLNDLHEHSQ